MPTYAKDWLLFPIEIDSTNDTVAFTEDGTGTTFTAALDAGLYWPYNGAEAGYPSLYASLLAKMNGTLAVNTYSFRQSTPDDSFLQLFHGLELVGDSDSWSLDFSNPAFTLDPKLLGFADGYATDVASTTDGTDEYVRSKFQTFNMWRSVSLFGGNYAAYKRSSSEIKVNDSHRDASGRFSMVWKTTKRRPLEYKRVRAAHVFADAADEAGYAEVADVAVGDDHNAVEYLWLALMKNQPVIVVHNVGEEWDLTLASYEWEVCKRRGDWPDDFADWLQNQTRAGERYDLSFDLTVVDETEGYSH